jgi:Tol biopolymer transport system component
MTITEKQFNSIGILASGNTNPQILLREPNHSFDGPRWSPDGNWIAFRQRDRGINVDHLGVIRKDSSGKRILKPQFDVITGPMWSVNNLTLGTLVRTSSGWLPIAVNIETEEEINLFPNPVSFFVDSWLELSPQKLHAVFMGFTEENSPKIELWMISLDGKSQKSIALPAQITPGCSYEDLNHPIDWSPDGMTFLVQFYEMESTGCRPSLWLFNLKNESWSNVASLPDEPPINIPPGFSGGWHSIYWSPDDRWVSWIRSSDALIYSTNDWKVIREIDLEVGLDILMFINPWVEDVGGNYIFSGYRDYTIAGLTNTKVDILGFSSNGAETDDAVLLRIESNEPSWLLEGSFSPYMWQP